MKKLKLFIVALVALLVPTIYANADTATTMPLPDGNKITLIEDVNLANRYDIPSNVTEIDLGGHTITLSNDAWLLSNSTTNLVITNGTINQTRDFAALVVANTGKVTLRNLNVSNKDSDTNGYAAVQAGAEGNTGSLVIDEGTVITGARGVSVFGNNTSLEIKGGRIETSLFAVSGNGDARQCNNSTITISGGTLISTGNAAIYQPQTGTLTITNGTITGKIGIVARQGDVSIDGGTITATGTEDEKIRVGDSKEGDGYVQLPTGVAIIVDNSSESGYADDANVTVTNGTINGDVDSLLSYGESKATEKEKEFVVSGGSFNNSIKTEYLSGDVQQSASGKVGTVYKVEITKPKNGKVTTDYANAVEGEEITVTVKADKGYELDKIVAKDAKGKEVKVTNGKFIMPDSNVTITVTFKKVEANPATGDNLLTYVSLGAIAFIGALGTGLYLKKVNE